MREIKFRAWDTKENKMYEPTYKAYEGNLHELCVNTYGNWFIRKVGDNVSVLEDEYIIMQYTGLKDKNGKEIYEGDIIEVDYGYNGKHKQKVEYFEGKFTPLVQVEEGYNCIDSYCEKIYEIIGNIYENPNLINNF